MYMYINTISYPRYNLIVSYISCFSHFFSSFPLISPFLGLTFKISHNRQRMINIRNPKPINNLITRKTVLS